MSQVKSKKRVADHGEVFTNEREVNAMLDLVNQETERIDSRFLEPACGNGNFLAEVLRRKLEVVETRFKKNQIEWERQGLIAVSSIYGVDILEDNAEECRERLFTIFYRSYNNSFGSYMKLDFLKSVKFMLKRNIIWGDALNFTNPVTQKPIVFSEWGLVPGDKIKRRDFVFKFLVEETHQFSLFNDVGEAAAIDEPVREFPPVHYLKLGL